MEMHIKCFTPDKRKFISIGSFCAISVDRSGTPNKLLSLLLDETIADIEDENYLELIALQIAFEVVENDAPFFESKELIMIYEPVTALNFERAPASATGENYNTTAESSDPFLWQRMKLISADKLPLNCI